MDRDAALEVMQKKGSQLCIGLDLRVPDGDKVNTALDIIDQTHDLTSAYKPNRQYWLGFSRDDMKEITDRIKHYNCFSIIDHKLSDIGSTNEASLTYAKGEGFDMITVSPFPGNMGENQQIASSLGLGLISLVLMSNRTAVWMSQSGYYKIWAEEAEKFADGIVIGTTNHVNLEHMKIVAELTPSTIVLAPGIGKQGGDVKEIRHAFGERALFNVSRGITMADNVREATEKYFAIIQD